MVTSGNLPDIKKGKDFTLKLLFELKLVFKPTAIIDNKIKLNLAILIFPFLSLP